VLRRGSSIREKRITIVQVLREVVRHPVRQLVASAMARLRQRLEAECRQRLAALRSCLEQDSERERRIRNGRRTAERHAWPRVADEIFAIHDEARRIREGLQR
jgi:hypothetical protein